MRKTLTAVIHLPPLPGTPRSRLTLEEIWSFVLSEARLLANAGITSVILENHGDAPFFPGANPPEIVAIMAVLCDRLKQEGEWHLGVNLLRNDGHGALSAALAGRADFIRVNILQGLAATDQGLIGGEAHSLMRTRHHLGAQGIEVWADVQVKFAQQLYNPDLATLIHATEQRALADAIIITGRATGQAADIRDLEVARAAGAGVPLVVGSGVTSSKLKDVLPLVDGVIVGSALKRGGYVENPLDPARLKSFTTAFSSLADD